jgi:hypothetical protein
MAIFNSYIKLPEGSYYRWNEMFNSRLGQWYICRWTFEQSSVSGWSHPKFIGSVGQMFGPSVGRPWEVACLVPSGHKKHSRNWPIFLRWQMKTDWCFGTFFPYIGTNHPHWRTPSFFRGVGLNYQPEKTWWFSRDLSGMSWHPGPKWRGTMRYKTLQGDG